MDLQNLLDTNFKDNVILYKIVIENCLLKSEVNELFKKNPCITFFKMAAVCNRFMEIGTISPQNFNR